MGLRVRFKDNWTKRVDRQTQGDSRKKEPRTHSQEKKAEKTEPRRQSRKKLVCVTCSFGMDGLVNDDLRCPDFCTIGKPELALCKGGIQIQLNQVLTGLVEGLSRTQDEVSFGNKTREVKTRQDKGSQDKTRQNKTKQNKTKQNKTKQNKTKQNKTKQNKTEQNKKRQDKTGQDKTR
jgi:hypothetical protein